jgi:hypothetical protein
MVNIEAIIFYVILLDAIMANFVALFASKWYNKTFKRLSKVLPLTKAWAAIYLFFILWVGSVLYRLGVLPF